MRKKLVSTVGSVLLALSLAACSTGTQTQDTAADAKAETQAEQKDTQAEASASGDSVTIKVFSNLTDRKSGQGFVEQTLFDQYMEENPNVTIEVEALDDEAYKTKFKAYASVSGMPDLGNLWGQPSFLE